MATPAQGTGTARPKTRSNTLRQAASAVFALTAILPLLLFVWTVHSLGALSRLQVQVGLGLALAVALLGFWVFRRLMGQMSDLILALGRAAEFASRSGARASAEAPRAPIGPASGAWARAAALPTPAASRPATPPAPPVVAEPASVTAAPSTFATTFAAPTPPPASLPASAATGEGLEATPEETSEDEAEADTVLGLGTIQEVHDLGRVMGVLWRAEAAGYRGRRVAVSVLSSPRPIIGTLIDLTDDGLLLETDASERLAVSFNRVSAIDAEESRTDE